MFAQITDLPITKNTEKQNDKVGKMRYYIPETFQLKKETEDQKEYEIKDNSGKQTSSFSIGKLEISALEDTKDSYKFINYNYLAKKFNIQDEIDLYHYYYDHKEDKNTIFTSMAKLQMDIFVKQYLLIVTTGGPNCTNYFLTKDTKGHLIECPSSNSFYATFVQDKDIYFVSYYGEDELTHQEFVNILSSISFD